jgi:hypothetical protein
LVLNTLETIAVVMAFGCAPPGLDDGRAVSPDSTSPHFVLCEGNLLHLGAAWNLYDFHS